MKIFVVICVFASLLAVHATPAISGNDNVIPGINRNHIEENFVSKLNTKCRHGDNHACLMFKYLVYTNRLIKKSVIDVTERMQLVQSRDTSEILDDPDDDALLARSFNSDDETVGLLVAGKLWKFIRSRMLRYKFSENADFIITTEPKGNLNLGVSISPTDTLAEGRGKNKNMSAMMMMMAGKAGIIGALILKGLFVLAGKALIVSKIALLLSVIIALKKLLSQKKHVVEIPHHDSYNSGGWGRALDGFLEGMAEVPAHFIAQDAQEMAFGGQQQLQTRDETSKTK